MCHEAGNGAGGPDHTVAGPHVSARRQVAGWQVTTTELAYSHVQAPAKQAALVTLLL